jgi:hypothetical protein
VEDYMSEIGENIVNDRIGNLDENKKKIIKEIRDNKDSSANDFDFEKVASKFIDCDIYYVSWKESKKIDDQEDRYYYVLADKNGDLTFYNDGIEAIDKLKNLLDRRRTFFQRLGEFSLFEVMAAIIAILVTLVFITLSLVSIYKPDALTKEFTGIFGIILGYYFGKTIPGTK